MGWACHPRIATDLQRNPKVDIRLHSDLSRHSRGSKTTFTSRIDEGEEGRRVLLIRPNERYGDDGSIDRTPSGWFFPLIGSAT